MRKDYIAVHDDATAAEIDFVERYWSRIWAELPEPDDGAVRDVRATDEFARAEPLLATLGPGARILDGGCGLGQWTVALSQLGYRPVGVDISAAAIERLHDWFPELEFAVGDVRATSFQDGAFDGCISCVVFEHFEAGLAPCLREAFRVLRPGGLLLLTVPFDNARHALLSLRDRGPDAPRSGERFYQWRLTRGELRRELALAGFEPGPAKPIHRAPGTLRLVRHQFRMRENGRWTMAVGLRLARILRGALVGHMVFASARRPWSV